ncbi:MAG: alpha/beta fold hydrolase, partial [Syntrophothermus sp.]
DDLFDVINKLEIDRPVICGLSMGGYIALRAVERDQAKFRGLILMDTKAEADDNSGKLKRAAAVKRINEEGIKGYITDFLPNCFSDVSVNEHPDVFPVVLERALHSSPSGLKGCLLAMAGRTDTSGFLGEIKLPTLVICGVLDAIVPAEQMRKMAEKIKDAEFAAVPRSGHMSAIENPEFVNDVISGFLKRRIQS